MDYRTVIACILTAVVSIAIARALDRDAGAPVASNETHPAASSASAGPGSWWCQDHMCYRGQDECDALLPDDGACKRARRAFCVVEASSNKSTCMVALSECRMLEQGAQICMGVE